MKYCMTDICFLFKNFCLKTVKHRVTDEASMELPLDLNTCSLEYENKSSYEGDKSSVETLEGGLWSTQLQLQLPCCKK